jgi:5-methylcytosine-specific restriction endonuclease McrA
MNDRIPIPAELRRRVLVEAGHRCAIPTCRHIDVDVHHIIRWEICQKHEYENLISLCPNCHRRAHKTNEIDRKSLYHYKANLRFTHDKFSQLEVDVLFECARNVGKQLMWAPFNVLLLKRLIESGYIQYVNTPAGVIVGGMKSNPDFISITQKGLDYIGSLGEVEL